MVLWFVSMVSEPLITHCVHSAMEAPGHQTRKGLPGKWLPTCGRAKATQSGAAEAPILIPYFWGIVEWI